MHFLFTTFDNPIDIEPAKTLAKDIYNAIFPFWMIIFSFILTFLYVNWGISFRNAKDSKTTKKIWIKGFYITLGALVGFLAPILVKVLWASVPSAPKDIMSFLLWL